MPPIRSNDLDAPGSLFFGHVCAPVIFFAVLQEDRRPPGPA